MERIRTWIITVISVIAGVLIGFFYAQVEAGKLQEQVSSLKTQLADKVSALESELQEVKKKAESAASELITLKADVDEKAKLIDDQKAKIEQLEAASQSTGQPPAQ